MIGAGPLIVIDTEVVGEQQVEAVVEHLHVVERGDRDAGVADLAVDVRALVRVAAVERDRIEGRGQALGRHALGDALEAAVGAEGVALAGEHAGRILVLALEGEDAGGEREGAGDVFLHQEAQDFAVVGELRQDDLANPGAGQRLGGQPGTDFLVADLHHIFVAAVGLDGVRPHVEQLPGLRVLLAVLPGNQFIEVRGRLVTTGKNALRDAQRLALAGDADLLFGVGVVATHGVGDFGEVAHAGGRHDGAAGARTA